MRLTHSVHPRNGGRRIGLLPLGEPFDFYKRSIGLSMKQVGL